VLNALGGAQARATITDLVVEGSDGRDGQLDYAINIVVV
jgi:hypothetical protein